MIGTAIKRFFGIVRRAIKRFIDWILGKNKNDNEQFKDTSEDKSSVAESTNEADEAEKAERRKKFEAKRNANIDEMKRLDEISKKNGEYRTMNERSHTIDTTTSYTGKNSDVKTWNNFKEALKEFKEKYDTIISLDSIINQETVIDLMYKCCNNCYKSVEQSKGNIEQIRVATKYFMDNVNNFKYTSEQNENLKNINNALLTVFGKSSAIENNKKFSEDDLINDPKMLDKLADDKVISYFKKLTSEQEKKLKTLEKLSDDFVKLCIKLVNDPRLGKTNIMGTKINESATYKGSINGVKQQDELNKRETHAHLLALQNAMKKWNDVTSKYNIALTTIYNYFLDVQKLRMSVRNYFEKTSHFKK